MASLDAYSSARVTANQVATAKSKADAYNKHIAENEISHDYSHFNRMSDIASHLHEALDHHVQDEAIDVSSLGRARDLVEKGQTASVDAFNRHRQGDAAGASAKLGEAATHLQGAAATIEGASEYAAKDLVDVLPISRMGAAQQIHMDYLKALPKGKK